jgi:hypothetical protein
MPRSDAFEGLYQSKNNDFKPLTVACVSSQRADESLRASTAPAGAACSPAAAGTKSSMYF